MVMAWISFPNILPTFFVKECLFSIDAAVGKPIQLDQVTIKKTRPSCARVKVLVDFKGKAKVLSSGKIVGDTSNWNVVKDRRGSPLKTITPNTEMDHQQHHEVVSPVHVHVGKEVVQNVSSDPSNTVHHVSHSKYQINQYEKEITKENKGQFTEVSQQSNISNILRKDKKANIENELAIVAFPITIEQDSQGKIFQSPNEILHDILIHKGTWIEKLQLCGSNQIEEAEDQIYRDVDLSPRSIKSMRSARKGKKHGSEDIIHPIKTQPKRNRIELWEELSQIVDGLDDPWIIRRDFNVVLNGDEKIDGLPVMGHEIEDFQNCI
ncbi:hypothetical protein H5410_030726 [Solanum commersonii]|uniref:DUF4283 domain-containing protein n=1 Tax=Solanum commersonii TaxID=4109 RepID=A0A9J5YJK1_SOLCO|nr:hypothetical protein H5410_030726 [Solanum commersonii]